MRVSIFLRVVIKHEKLLSLTLDTNMMKKIASLFLVMLLVACGDDALVITIPASSSFSYNVPASAVNASQTLEFSDEANIDPGQIFTETAEQIKSIALNKMTYDISGYQNDPAEIELVTIIIESRVSGAVNELARITDLPLLNVQDGLLFEEGNPTSILSATQVASLEATLDNFSAFDLILKVSLNKVIDSDFTIEISWNISAQVEQNTGG